MISKKNLFSGRILNPLFRENFIVSLKSITSSRLRSLLTIAVIATGITSLVGILTATDSLKAVMNDNFGRMGVNTFSIRSNYSDVQSALARSRVINRRNISYNQARLFKDNFNMPSVVSISATAVYNAVIKSGSEKTNPVIRVVATDENNLRYSSASISKGVNLNENDIESSSFRAVIGSGVASALFGGDEPLGKVISVGAVRYEVVGVLERQGATFGGGVDNEVWIPVSNARSLFLTENSFYAIGVVPLGDNQEKYMAAAELLFRSVRRLTPSDPSDFRITRSDAVLEDIRKVMSYVTIAAFIIGSITLLGAAVGLMNIMLVAVKERTREIGTRKALGATSFAIKQQFLFESIVIGQLGAFFGIILGVGAGNLTALLMKTPFVVPWLWILSGVVICLFVSIASGYIPAVRASGLDPIEALRYE